MVCKEDTCKGLVATAATAGVALLLLVALVIYLIRRNSHLKANYAAHFFQGRSEHPILVVGKAHEGQKRDFAPGTQPGAEEATTPAVEGSHNKLQRQVTFVVTDVEGSTELWEWDSEAMDRALELHDACLRVLLYRNYGHEVTTEGDSFTTVFHDASDAVNWCLQVQQAMLAVQWPQEVLSHTHAAEVCADGLPEMSHMDSIVHMEADVLFRGLRVRMGCHTGSSCTVSKHPVTGFWEYTGETRQVAEQIAEAAHGGQVLVCEVTSQHIYSRLVEISGIEAGYRPSADNDEESIAPLVNSARLHRKRSSSLEPVRRSAVHPAAMVYSSTAADATYGEATEELAVHDEGGGLGQLWRNTIRTLVGGRAPQAPGPDLGATDPSTTTQATQVVSRSASLLQMPFTSQALPASGHASAATLLDGPPVLPASLRVLSQTWGMVRPTPLDLARGPLQDDLQQLASAAERGNSEEGPRPVRKPMVRRSASTVGMLMGPAAPSAAEPDPSPSWHHLMSLRRASVHLVGPSTAALAAPAAGEADVDESLLGGNPAEAAPSSGPMLVDMGRFELQHVLGGGGGSSLNIMLVVVHAMRKRLMHWPPELKNLRKLQGGFLDAPSTLQSLRYVGRSIPASLRPRLTMAFCSMDPETASSLYLDTRGTALAAFCGMVRATLPLCRGYECQEKGGIFMIAFHCMREAMEWGLLLQMALMELQWEADGTPPLANTQAVVCPKTGEVCLKGLRARVGLFHGEVVKVTPHSRTGRADYFGPVLNRAARLQSAAHGGQVLVEGLAADLAVQQWRAVQRESSGPHERSSSRFLPGSPSTRTSLTIAISPTLLARRTMAPTTPTTPTHQRMVPSSSSHHTPGLTLPPEPGRGASPEPAGEVPAAPAGFPSGASPGLGCGEAAGFTTSDSLVASTLRRASGQSMAAQDGPGTHGGGSSDGVPAASQPVSDGCIAGASSRSLSVIGLGPVPGVSRLPVAVDIIDSGYFSMKGVDTQVPVTLLIPSRLGGRLLALPSGTASNKVKQVRKGVGKTDTVIVDLPDLRQIQMLGQTTGTPGNGDEHPLLQHKDKAAVHVARSGQRRSRESRNSRETPIQGPTGHGSGEISIQGRSPREISRGPSEISAQGRSSLDIPIQGRCSREIPIQGRNSREIPIQGGRSSPGTRMQTRGSGEVPIQPLAGDALLLASVAQLLMQHPSAQNEPTLHQSQQLLPWGAMSSNDMPGAAPPPAEATAVASATPSTNPHITEQGGLLELLRCVLLQGAAPEAVAAALRSLPTPATSTAARAPSPHAGLVVCITPPEPLSPCALPPAPNLSPVAVGDAQPLRVDMDKRSPRAVRAAAAKRQSQVLPSQLMLAGPEVLRHRRRSMEGTSLLGMLPSSVISALPQELLDGGNLPRQSPTALQSQPQLQQHGLMQEMVRRSGTSDLELQPAAIRAARPKPPAPAIPPTVRAAHPGTLLQPSPGSDPECSDFQRSPRSQPCASPAVGEARVWHSSRDRRLDLHIKLETWLANPLGSLRRSLAKGPPGSEPHAAPRSARSSSPPPLMPNITLSTFALDVPEDGGGCGVGMLGSTCDLLSTFAMGEDMSPVYDDGELCLERAAASFSVGTCGLGQPPARFPTQQRHRSSKLQVHDEVFGQLLPMHARSSEPQVHEDARGRVQQQGSGSGGEGQAGGSSHGAGAAAAGAVGAAGACSRASAVPLATGINTSMEALLASYLGDSLAEDGSDPHRGPWPSGSADLESQLAM